MSVNRDRYNSMESVDTQWLYPEENNDREEDMKWCSQGGTAKVYMVQNE